MIECACFSTWTLVLCDPTDAVSSLGVVCLALSLPLLGAPVAGLSSSRFLVLKWESLIFCQKCLGATNFNLQLSYFLSPNVVSWAYIYNKYFNSSTSSTSILYRLSQKLPVVLSVTADNTSSHFVSKAWTLSFSNWTVDKSLKFRRLHCRTNFEDVVDHPSNLSDCKWSVLCLSFSIGRGDLFLQVFCQDFSESASNLELKILEARYWLSCKRCWSNEIVNTFYILNLTYP